MSEKIPRDCLSLNLHCYGGYIYTKRFGMMTEYQYCRLFNINESAEEVLEFTTGLVRYSLGEIDPLVINTGYCISVLVDIESCKH